MELSEYLPPQLVKVPLGAGDKSAAIAELVDLIAEQGLTKRRDQLLAAVMEREAQKTTGIGRGFAVPHAKTDAIDNMTIAIGKMGEPIEFDAIDGKPVTLIALIASPTSETRLHMQALARLSRLVMSQDTYEKMLVAQSAEDLHKLAINGVAG